MSCSQEETFSTTRTTMKRKSTSHVPIHLYTVNLQLILVTIQIVKAIQRNLTIHRLLKPISLQSSMLSSVAFLQNSRAPAQRMTAKILYTLVSRLASQFLCTLQQLAINFSYYTRPDSPGGPGGPWPTQKFFSYITTYVAIKLASSYM